MAWGSPQRIIERADRLHDAGAAHVALTVIGASDQPTGLTAARLLAAAFD